MLLCVIKAVLAWVILLLVGTNLIGFVVRGLFWMPPAIPDSTDRVNEILLRETSRMNLTNRVMNMGGIFAIGTYLFILFHYWNASLAGAGAVVMASRVPDLLHEIRMGRKPTFKELPKALPRGPMYFATATILWASLPLVWYSLCG